MHNQQGLLKHSSLLAPAQNAALEVGILLSSLILDAELQNQDTHENFIAIYQRTTRSQEATCHLAGKPCATPAPQAAKRVRRDRQPLT